MMRNCTLEYKINLIQKYVRWELLGYRKGQHIKPEDLKAHEMHIGFSYEEDSVAGKIRTKCSSMSFHWLT